MAHDPTRSEPANAGERDPMRWVWRGITGATLVLGWIFILWQNKFHIDPPVVIISLGFLAVVLAVTNLWRVGAAAVAPEHAGEEAWARPLGARWELEKEKKTLLKAIKDAEFDHAMGKLSKRDADELIRLYRARAIEVIKELDRMDAGHAETPRQKVEREIAARIALEHEKTKGSSKKKTKKADAPEAAKPAEAKQSEQAEASAAVEPAAAETPASVDAETSEASS